MSNIATFSARAPRSTSAQATWTQAILGAMTRPISPLSLAVVRIMFGAILLWDCFRYINADRIRRYYVDVEMTFPYFGMDWLQPLPAPYIYWAWGMVGVTAFLIMIGLFTRAATVAFLIVFGYFFLLDRTQYLNHNYMVLLYAALLALAPSNRALSMDAWLWPGVGRDRIAAWPVLALKLQTEIILIYAGVVKITDDWLRGEPLRTWLSGRQDDIWFGALFQYDWAFVAAAWGTVGLHILGAPLLLWRRTRVAVFLVYVGFHISNATLFNIGIFPWITIAISTIFFTPDWPARVVRWVAGAMHLRADAAPPQDTGRVGGRLSPALLIVLGVWFAVQIGLPLRQAAFPNLVGWTGDGHRFSWRMRIYDRDVDGRFTVVSADGTQTWLLDTSEFLTGRQAHVVMTRPDLIHDFAGKLEQIWAANGHADVAVYADIRKSLNSRPLQTYVDPDVDLTTVTYNLFGPDDWVLPLQSRAAENRVAAWLPPFPLQRP